MDIKLQLFFLLTSVATLLFVVSNIRRNKLNIDDSVFWILWALMLLIFSLFPIIPTSLAKLFGFQATSNFILCLFIFFLYILHFYQSMSISALKDKNKELIQKLSLKEYKEKSEK